MATDWSNETRRQIIFQHSSNDRKNNGYGFISTV